MSESVKLCMHMHGRKEACYPLGISDSKGAPGLGCLLFYINLWAMIWPVDYKKGGFWEMSIKQSLSKQTRFLAKTKCVFVCACWRTVHCNSVSRSCAAEFTVILSYTLRMHTYTFIYIQILTLHIVFPSLQQPAVSKYMHIMTYTFIYQQIRSNTIWCICTYLVRIWCTYMLVSLLVYARIARICTYARHEKVLVVSLRANTCNAWRYYEIRTRYWQYTNNILANTYQIRTLFGGSKKVRIAFFMFILQVYVRIM